MEDPKQPAPAPLLSRNGGYRRLRSFQTASLIYDATVVFCDRFIDRRSRTHDQMVQAARSGVRNIEEGSVASATSKKTELKLTNVARASLEELLRDYEDFLRHRGLPVWTKDSSEALGVRAMLAAAACPDLPSLVRDATPEVAANTLICLIHQASYLLRRQLDRLDRDFLAHGGFTERLYRARTEAREAERQRGEASDKSDKSDASDRSDSSDRATSPADPSARPACPQCGRPMVLRTARRGVHAGSTFWGCSSYPQCTALLPTLR